TFHRDRWAHRDARAIRFGPWRPMTVLVALLPEQRRAPWRRPRAARRFWTRPRHLRRRRGSADPRASGTWGRGLGQAPFGGQMSQIYSSGKWKFENRKRKFEKGGIARNRTGTWNVEARIHTW